MSEAQQFENAVCERDSGDGGALLCLIDNDRFWIPRSVVHWRSEVKTAGDEGALVIASWFADKMSAEVQRGETDTHDDSVMAPPIRVTRDQRDIVMRAVQSVRRVLGEPDMSDGRALELMAADYLAGASA